MRNHPIRLIAILVLIVGAIAASVIHRSFAPQGRAPEATPLPTLSEGHAVPSHDFLALLVRATPDPNTGPAPTKAPEIALDAGPLSWEKQLQEILQDPPSSEKGAQLLTLLPSLPEEAYGPATEQALDWLADADYTNAALPLLLNVNTHGAVLAELYRDIVERPAMLSLPALLTIARTAEHPYAGPAHETLATLMGEDLATDWVGWDAAVRQRLAAEPPR
jgi:hypothetical protein